MHPPPRSRRDRRSSPRCAARRPAGAVSRESICVCFVVGVLLAPITFVQRSPPALPFSLFECAARDTRLRPHAEGAPSVGMEPPPHQTILGMPPERRLAASSRPSRCTCVVIGSAQLRKGRTLGCGLLLRSMCGRGDWAPAKICEKDDAVEKNKQTSEQARQEKYKVNASTTEHPPQ